MEYYNNTRERLAAVARAVGWPEPDEWTADERDQINAMAKEEDRNIERFPVVHAWRTDSGSGLEFWCKYCKSHHTHGRHSGPSYAEAITRWDAEDNWVPRVDAALPLNLWRRYLARFGKCKFNPNVPGGRGFCTCPMGSGDGHRATHCGNRDSGPYYEHGYILHEVEPNDARATAKPKRMKRR